MSTSEIGDSTCHNAIASNGQSPSPANGQLTNGSSNRAHVLADGHNATNGHNSSPSAATETIEVFSSRLQAYCSRVAVPGVVVQEALNVANTLLPSGEKWRIQDDPSSWFSCVVYMAFAQVREDFRASEPQDSNGNEREKLDFTVTDLLQRGGTSVPELFKHMKVLSDAHPLPEPCAKDLLNLKRKYCITAPLFSKFEKILTDVFSDQFIINGSQTTSTRIYEKKKLCWTLFVFAKSRALNGLCELVVAFYLLLCCLDYVLSATPPFMLASPYDMGEILPRLCAKYNASLEEVRLVHSKVLEPILAELPMKDGAIDLPALAELYSTWYRSQVDINELLFLEHDRHLLVSQENRPHTPPSISAHHVQQVAKSSALMKAHDTPVRSAMNTVQQLKSLLNTSSDESSAVLKQYFKRCSQEPTVAIETCVNNMREDFVSHFLRVAGQHQSTLAHQRFLLARRLYHRVLENLLRQEEERLSLSDFSHLLNNMTFHKCLLACSLEVVLMTYENSASHPAVDTQQQESPIGFPWILNVFDIQAYDFLKVIESFVKSETCLGREIKKHLQSVENQILEKIVWESSSSLHGILAMTEVLRPSMPPPMPGNQPAETASSAAELYLSPRPFRGTGTPPTPNRNVRQHRSQSLNIFFQKVSRLGYHRLEELCAQLDIPKDSLPKIWTCFDHCLMDRYDLFNGRHLDQILMCSVYAVSKVLEHEIKFKAIVAAYRTLPHTLPQVYRRVFIQDTEYDTVIGFYNRVFLDATKHYVLQFAQNRKAPSLSPAPTSMSPHSGNQAYSLSGRQNFIVKPLIASPFKTPISPNPTHLTPLSMRLHSFGEGPGSSEKLRSFNDMMSQRSLRITPAKRSQRSLNFDNMDDQSGLDLLQAKRARVSAQTCKSLQFGDSQTESGREER